MQIEGNLIAISYCCGFELVHLVGRRLQTWKKILYRWEIEDWPRCDISWLLRAGQIVGNIYKGGEPQPNEKSFFVIDLQTENVKTAALANDQTFVS